jgi:hypothetical protein
MGFILYQLPWLARPVCDPLRTKCGRFGLLGCIPEDVIPPSDLEILEPGCFYFLF